MQKAGCSFLYTDYLAGRNNQCDSFEITSIPARQALPAASGGYQQDKQALSISDCAINDFSMDPAPPVLDPLSQVVADQGMRNPGKKKSKRKFNWPRDTAFMLYASGVPNERITQICAIFKEKWSARRDLVNAERIKAVGPGIYKEQEMLRAKELEFSKQLMNVASQMLASFKPTVNCSPDKIVRMLELASKLGRMSTGLPLTSIEVQPALDLPKLLMDNIEKVYGDEPKDQKQLPTIDVQATEVKPENNAGNNIPAANNPPAGNNP
jgi:hypothetical protein